MRLLWVGIGLCLAPAAVLAEETAVPGGEATAIIVQLAGPVARLVRGDDGKDHAEYDLMVSNAWTGDVMLTGLDIRDAAGKLIQHIEGDTLAAATQTLLTQKPLAAIPASGVAAVEVDVILEPGTAPDTLMTEVSYTLDPKAPLPSIVGALTAAAPPVTVDHGPAITILPPLSGPGWASLNGCCEPNTHRSVRVAAGSRLATPETFAVDWIRLDDGRFFTGEGKANTDYPYFGAEIHAVADGEVVRVRDGMAESIPFQPVTTVKKPEDFGGNYVLMRIEPDVYAIYAHMQPGSLKVKPGDKVAAGDVLGLLGSSGNSTNPHLHFGLLDRPDFMTGVSLPFVFPSYTRTGTITGGDGATLEVTPMDLAVTAAYPMVYGVDTYP